MKLFKKVLVIAFVVSLAASMMVSQANAYFILSGVYIPIRVIPPIVSTAWLNRAIQLKLPNLVVLDIRTPDMYEAGHVPGAINVPDAEWYINDPFTVPIETPWMEMPPVEDLFALIGSAGITSRSLVVVVGSTSGPLAPIPFALYGTATITRVAITLLYAGVINVAILDGGYEKWVADGYPVETTINTPTPVVYQGQPRQTMLVTKEYVYSKIGKSIIVDARDPEVYTCQYIEYWCKEGGHIPTAVNLPTPSLWNIKVDEETGRAVYITYKDTYTLMKMAYDVVGCNRYKEIIVYCGVGGYASTTYFVLKELLRYLDVKFYDGSAQEWTHAGLPTECV